MKRLVAFIVCMMMLVSSVAVGEDEVFSFRNEIYFGDSAEIVQEKEGNKGGLQQNEFGFLTLSYVNMSLSGIEKSALNYYFYANDQGLFYIELQYRRVPFYKRKIDLHKSDYDVIQQGLETKYGNPIQYTNLSELKMFKNGAISSYYMNSDYEFIYANQWMIDHDDKHRIIIEHSLIQHNEMPAATYMHRLSYRLVDLNEKETDLILDDL